MTASRMHVPDTAWIRHFDRFAMTDASGMRAAVARNHADVRAGTRHALPDPTQTRVAREGRIYMASLNDADIRVASVERELEYVTGFSTRTSAASRSGWRG